MEFEMIVPNVKQEEGDGDPEADYYSDESSGSIQNIRNFFYDRNYNGLREVDSLVDELTESYHEWADERRSEQWDSEGKDYLREYIESEGEFDEDAALDEAYDQLGLTDEQKELTDEQKLTLNSLRYILKSSKKTTTFSIWGFLLSHEKYNEALTLSEKLDIKLYGNDFDYIEKVLNSNDKKLNDIKINLINFFEKLPIDVLKKLPSNILINLPTEVFNNLSSNNFLSKTKMKARTIGRVKTFFGYGGTKKKRASKRRKNNKRSRRIH
jgi:hypothetical protein